MGTSIKYVGIKIVHNTVFSSFLTYDWVCNKSNTTDATGGAGTIYTSDVRPRYLVRFVVLDVFFVVFRRALFFVFFVPRFTASDYPLVYYSNFN